MLPKRRLIIIPMTIALALLVSLSVIFWADSDARSQHVSRFEVDLESNQTWQRPVAANNIGGDPEYGTFDALTAGHRACPYAVLYLRPQLSGPYSIETVLARFEDPILFVYEDAFDPAQPLDHFLIGDDDSGHVLLPKLSQDNLTLRENQVYAVVLSSFWSDVSGATHLEIRGPATVDQAYPATYLAGDGGHLEGPEKQFLTAQELGAPVTAVAQEGYRFAGWSDGQEDAQRRDENLSAPLKVKAQFTAFSEQTYRIEHHLQNETLSGFDLKESETNLAQPGTQVKAEPLSLTGFAENLDHPQRLAEGIVPRDDSLVLKLYYDREHFDLRFDSQGGSPQPDDSVPYQAVLEAPDTPQKEGYEFTGWSWSPDDLQLVDFGSERMPATDLVLHAFWQPREDTPYRLEQFMQTKNREGYEKAGSQEKAGLTGEKVHADVERPAGYRLAEDHPQTKASGRIQGDGSLTLRLFWDRLAEVTVVSPEGLMISGLQDALDQNLPEIAEAIHIQLSPQKDPLERLDEDTAHELKAVSQQREFLDAFSLSIEATFTYADERTRTMFLSDEHFQRPFTLALPATGDDSTSYLCRVADEDHLHLAGTRDRLDEQSVFRFEIDAPGTYAVLGQARAVSAFADGTAEPPADDILLLHLFLGLLYPIALLILLIRKLKQGGSVA